MKTLTPLRHAVKSPHVNRIVSKIIPSASMHQGKSVTAVYLKPTKSMSLPDFPMNEECISSTYILPIFLLARRSVKAWLSAIPRMFVDSRLGERGHDTAQDIPEAELAQLVIAFLK
eukprot:scpid109554/ scgid18040/ 